MLTKHFGRRLKRRNNSAAKHRAETAHVEGSGTACTWNANPAGEVSPVMKLGLIRAPVMALYSRTVPAGRLATKRLLAESCARAGVSPVMKLGLMAAPVVASYLPTLWVLNSATKRSFPESARLKGLFSPVMKLALMAAPVMASYSPTLPACWLT